MAQTIITGDKSTFDPEVVKCELAYGGRR